MHLSLHPLGSPPSAPVAPRCRPVVSHAERRSRPGGDDGGGKKRVGGWVGWGSKVMVAMPALTSRRHTKINTHTHTLAHMAFLLLFISHTHSHTLPLHWGPVGVFFCIHTHQSRSNDKAKRKKEDTKKGGSPRLSGMTKKNIKAFKREGLKQ